MRIATPDEIAAAIPSRSVISVSGLVGSLVPDATLAAIRRRFDLTGAPTDLTVVFPVAVGDVFDAPGLDHLAHVGLIRTVVGGSYVYGRRPDTNREPDLTRLILEEEIDAYNFPIGVMFAALRETAAKRPGLFTRVGLGSVHDPRHGGGRMNKRTPPAFVSVVELDGREYLRYQLPAPDVAIVRGTTADELGNVTMEREVVTGGLLVHAAAAHNNGGVVVAQVDRLAAAGSLDARSVRLPGSLVDLVTVVPGEQQATGVHYNPYLSGELRAPETHGRSELEPIESLILEKAASRLQPGDLVILGFGIPSKLPSVPSVPPGVRFTVEHGAIGGVPSGGLVFGGAFNPEAVIETPSQFDVIDGGGCDAACLGFAEVAADGSVNVSRLPQAFPGSGGFTNITAATRRLLFCGTFTAGGLDVRVQGGAVEVVQEGRFKKFVRQPRELTFKAGLLVGQQTTFITDRCVIEVIEGGLVITEVYPGIDVARNVTSQAEFPLEIAT